MLESASRGGSAWSGVSAWSGGVSAWSGGVSAWSGMGVFLVRGGAWSRGGLVSQHALRQTPSPCGQTDTCKNITLATTSLRPVIKRNIFVKEIQEFRENDIVKTKRLLKFNGEIQYFAFCTFSTLTIIYQFFFPFAIQHH